MKRHACWGIVSALVCSSTLAHAREEAKASLSWRSGDVCIQQEGVERQVEQRLARRVFVAREEADILLEVAVTPTADQRRSIAVTLRSQRGVRWGERKIQVPAQCDVLESSLVLMLSLTADIAKEEVERRVQRDRLRTTSVAPVLSLSGVAGLLPHVSLGPELGFGVYHPWLGWWQLSAAWYPKESLNGSYPAEFAAGLVSLSACPLALHGVRMSVWACAVGHGGYLAAKGHGFDTSYRQLEPAGSAGGAIRGSWELGEPWFVAASVGGDIALTRTRFYYETALNRRDLFSTSTALFFVNLGLGLRL